MPRTNAERAGVVLAAALAFALLVPVPALAWSLSKSTNGAVLVPTSTDSTGTYDVVIDSDYKGGFGYSASYDPTVFGSYNTHTSVGSFSWPQTVYCAGLEVPLSSTGGRIQRVVLNNTTAGKADYCFVTLFEPLSVSIDNTHPIDVDAAMTSSVSVAGTLPVSIQQVGDLPRNALTTTLVLGVLVGGGLMYKALDKP